MHLLIYIIVLNIIHYKLVNVHTCQNGEIGEGGVQEQRYVILTPHILIVQLRYKI